MYNAFSKLKIKILIINLERKLDINIYKSQINNVASYQY